MPADDPISEGDPVPEADDPVPEDDPIPEDDSAPVEDPVPEDDPIPNDDSVPAPPAPQDNHAYDPFPALPSKKAVRPSPRLPAPPHNRPQQPPRRLPPDPVRAAARADSTAALRQGQLPPDPIRMQARHTPPTGTLPPDPIRGRPPPARPQGRVPPDPIRASVRPLNGAKSQKRSVPSPELLYQAYPPGFADAAPAAPVAPETPAPAPLPADVARTQSAEVPKPTPKLQTAHWTHGLLRQASRENAAAQPRPARAQPRATSSAATPPPAATQAPEALHEDMAHLELSNGAAGSHPPGETWGVPLHGGAVNGVAQHMHAVASSAWPEWAGPAHGADGSSHHQPPGSYSPGPGGAGPGQAMWAGADQTPAAMHTGAMHVHAQPWQPMQPYHPGMQQQMQYAPHVVMHGSHTSAQPQHGAMHAPQHSAQRPPVRPPPTSTFQPSPRPNAPARPHRPSANTAPPLPPHTSSVHISPAPPSRPSAAARPFHPQTQARPPARQPLQERSAPAAHAQQLGGGGAAAAPAPGRGGPARPAIAPPDTPWSCPTCTYMHEGSEALFLTCAMCGCARG